MCCNTPCLGWKLLLEVSVYGKGCSRAEAILGERREERVGLVGELRELVAQEQGLVVPQVLVMVVVMVVVVVVVVVVVKCRVWLAIVIGVRMVIWRYDCS